MSSDRPTGAANLSPTWAEMAARHRSKSRYHLACAEKYGDTPKGRQHMADAESFARIAASFSEKAAEASASRDGLLDEYRKARANV